jgi:hypothetical protein
MRERNFVEADLLPGAVELVGLLLLPKAGHQNDTRRILPRRVLSFWRQGFQPGMRSTTALMQPSKRRRGPTG